MKNLEAVVKQTQLAVNKIAPGKVTISIDRTDGQRCLVGAYETPSGPGAKSEKLDKHFEVDFFLSFFNKRAKWLNASMEEKLAYNGHPQMF